MLQSRKPENFLIPKFEWDEHNVSSEENCVKSNWKSNGGGSTAMKSSAIVQWILYSVLRVVTLHGAAGAPLQNLEGDGQPARAGGRCLVTMPSRPDRARKFRGRVVPARACGRGSANWYPGQYPTPAGLLAFVGWAD